jgi:starch-binding outer membrane protein, SusD/RagB family
MKKTFNHTILSLTLAAALLTQSSCKKDYINPNAATDVQVFSSPVGLTGAAIGLQRVYTAGRASSLYNRVSINGLLTNELIVLNQGNTAEYQLQLGGGSVDGTNTMLGGLWSSSNKILYESEKILTAADALTDKAYASGLIGYTTIFRALALGDLAMFWEKIPAGNGKNVTFIDRAEGYTRAIAAIDKALALIAANPISASFNGNVTPGFAPTPTTGVNTIIPNTLNALKARYSLFLGNYTQALTAANAVDLSVKSAFTFSSVNQNPIFETVTSTNNVTAVGDNVTLGLPAGLQPDAGDKRVPFYTTGTGSKVAGFGAGSLTPWPIYLPSEMTLIKAEANARAGGAALVTALIELNKVVTKTPASDPFGVGADLPPLVGLTQQQILDQIYKHRSIELFMSGLKLEDMRRFGRPTSERKRNLLPYPFLERDNNPNTPPDPAF